jgi:hypothetical protein
VAELDDLLAQIPMGQVAARLGVDEQTAEQATRQALPALLAGMHANAQDPDGAQSLAEAVNQHQDSLLDGGVDVGQVDTGDGDKIVGHVFGANRDQVVNQLGGLGGSDSAALVRKLLPILAPIVMAYIAKKLGMGNASQPGRQSSDDNGLGGLGGVLGPILGGLLGGGGGAASGSGGGFGDILGQILAGQEPQAPVQQHDDGRFEQPTFNPPEGGDGQVTMPTAEDDSSGGQQQQKPSGGIGDILGGLFGR